MAVGAQELAEAARSGEKRRECVEERCPIDVSKVRGGGKEETRWWG
jgi:hypothetical protein